MAISRETQNQIAKEDFAGIENAWLQRIEQGPIDVDYFVGVARALTGQHESDRAATLLELLDTELRERGMWAERLLLLRKAGSLYLAADKQHPSILATLKRRYADRPSFEGLSQSVGLQRAVDDLPKTWEKVERLEGLLQYDVGEIVWMEGKGAGRVAEVNFGLEGFKVDFEKQRGVTVGFRAAAKLLKPLPPGHLLRRKLEEPDSLAALRDQAPSELLREVLQSHARPLSAGEIKEALAGIVSDAQWTSWWAQARRHEQVVTSGGGGRQSYAWAASGGHASDAVWRSFERADVAGKMDLLRKNADRDAALRERMVAALIELGARAAVAQPALAYEIWWALDRAGAAPAGVAWAPETLLRTVDPRQILPAVGDRQLRERGYALLRSGHPDWAEAFADLLPREEDPRSLAFLAEELRKAAPSQLDRFYDQTLTQPRKAAGAFVWLAERAADEPAIAGRSPLRLLQQILGALISDDFTAYRTRLRPLLDSGGTVAKLLPLLQEEQAPQAYDTLSRAAGLEGFQRQPLLTALELRFPALRRGNEALPLYATPAAIAERRAELKHLLDVEIPQNRKAIEEARALGDLRENFEYKSARQRHEYLAARTAQLDGELRRVRPLEPETIDTTEARIGTRLQLRSPAGETRTLTILGPWESKPEADIISYESDAAGRVLGKKTGEAIEWDARPYTIAAIEPYA